MWDDLKDWLFRIGIYWGVRINPPACLFVLENWQDGQLFQSRTISINHQHELADWLLNDCQGPWKMKVQPAKRSLTSHIRFARVEDAAMFRLMM